MLFRSFPSLFTRHKFQSVPLPKFLGIFVNKGWVALERIQLFTYFCEPNIGKIICNFLFLAAVALN